MTAVVPRMPVPAEPLAADAIGRRTEVLTNAAWRAAAAARVGPAGTRWALLLVDVDRFSEVNARHGHPAADAVLAGVVATLRGIAGHEAVVGRFGGDEFVALVPGTDRSAALRAADQVCLAVRRMTVTVRSPAGRRTVGGVTVSVGVAVHPATAPDVGLLLWAADAALYAAKRDGGDSAQAVDPRHHL